MYHYNSNQQENENLKDGNGQLVGVIIGVKGNSGTKLWLYDGISDAAPLICEINMATCDSWLGFDLEFKDGLTYKCDANAGKFTIIYR